jgi:Pentapeptide repeats (8 copies)
MPQVLDIPHDSFVVCAHCRGRARRHHTKQEPREQPFLPPPQRRRGRWGWTGFANRTLWNWLQLLIVPVMIAIVGAGFTAAQGYIQLRAEERRAQDEALQAYLEGMGDLLLDEGLLSSQEGEEVRTLARARTLTILGQVDGARKRSVVLFLYESQLILLREPQLIQEDLPIVVISGADLSDANLSEAVLDLADLSDANLSGADLSGVTGVSTEDLEAATSNLRGTTMPDGSKHP